MSTTIFSQAVRDRFDRWSGGRTEISTQTLDRMANEGNVEGEDAAVLSVLQRSREKLHIGKNLKLSTLESYEGRVAQGDTTVEDGYADMLRRLQTPKTLFAQGLPDPTNVQQGAKGDCVLSSTLIALSYQRPQDLTEIIKRDEAGEIVFNLPNDHEKHLPEPSDWDLVNQSCAYENGMWMTSITKQMGEVGALMPGRAITALTGRDVDQDFTRFSSDSGLRRKLNDSFMMGRVVLATRNTNAEKVPGLTANHCFAVLGYDAQTDEVMLQDPARNEPVDAKGNALDGNKDGRFFLPLPAFRSSFSRIQFEKSDQGPGKHPFFSKIGKTLREMFTPVGSKVPT